MAEILSNVWLLLKPLAPLLLILLLILVLLAMLWTWAARRLIRFEKDAWD